MNRFLTRALAGSLLILAAACSAPAPAPLTPSDAKPANSGCRSGWLVRTGADGQPVVPADSVCRDDL
jgi:hypothetical protein